MGNSDFIDRYDVEEKIAARVKSEIRDNPVSEWVNSRARLKREFSSEIKALYCQGRCEDPEGRDLIEAAVNRHAPDIRSEVVHKIRTRLIDVVEDAPTKAAALWSEVRKDILRENRLAMGVLESAVESADSSDLIKEALKNVCDRARIVVRCDVAPGGKAVKYLVKVGSETPTGCMPCPTGEYSLPEPKRKFPRSKLTYVIITTLGALAAIATLLGVDVFDILPVCNVWPFSVFPGC